MLTFKSSRFSGVAADEETGEREFNKYLNYLEKLNYEMNIESEQPSLKASMDLGADKNHEE